MLVGRPPFETATLKETYVRITTNKYTMPNFLSAPARSLISKLLSADPKDRPTLDRMLAEDFFNTGYTPKVLTTSCCETAPKFPASAVAQQSHRWVLPFWVIIIKFCSYYRFLYLIFCNILLLINIKFIVVQIYKRFLSKQASLICSTSFAIRGYVQNHVFISSAQEFPEETSSPVVCEYHSAILFCAAL